MIPLVVRLQKSFQAWAQPGFEPFRFDYNIDRIDALSSERAAEWHRIDSASFLTNDEKREAAGYGAMPKDARIVDKRLAEALERRYSPDQPRDDIGRWTSGGGGAGDRSALNIDPNITNNAVVTRVGQNENLNRYSVDLQKEEGYGHSIRDHVGKTDAELIEVLDKNKRTVGTANIGLIDYQPAEGAFFSRESANDFVNRTLEANKDAVDAVAEGKEKEATLERIFGYQTGTEAFRAAGNEAAYIRPTFAVRVIIHADPSSAKGFKVRTAFPTNPRQSR